MVSPAPNTNYETNKSAFGEVGRGRDTRGHSVTGPIVLDSLDSVGQGFNRGNYPLTRNQRYWARWYDLNYIVGLFPSPTLTNGLEQLNKTNSLMELPMFRDASDFLADAAMSDMPSPSGWDDDQARQDWWTEHMPLIERALQRGTNYWAIYNLAVFAAEEGGLRAVNPIDYYRVGRPEERDADVGHVLMFPYRQDAAARERAEGDAEHYDAIEIVKVPPRDEGVPTTQRFQYSGEAIGAPLSGAGASTITGVHTAGEGRSRYPGAADTAAAYMIGLSMYTAALNDFDNRPLAIPSGVATSMAGVAANTEEGLASIRRQFQDIYRPIIALDENQDMMSGELREPAPMQDRREQLLMLADLFFMQMRLTPSSFGIGIGRGESGVAREKAQDAAGVLVRRYRRQLASALGLLVELMGIPGGRGGVQFSWAIPPFQSREAREEQVRLDYEAGLITLNEARAELGRGMLEDGRGDMFAGEQSMDALDGGGDMPEDMGGAGEDAAAASPRSAAARFMRPNG